MLTRAFTGRYARGLVNRYVRDMLPHEAALPAYPWQSRMIAPLAQAAGRAGIADLMPLWAGRTCRSLRGGRQPSWWPFWWMTSTA